MHKRTLIVLLAGLNLLLLAGVILFSWSPPAAYAQATPMGRNYAVVAGEINDGRDALYILDLPRRRMHVFVPNRDQANRRLFYAGYRDLQRDFRGGR